MPAIRVGDFTEGENVAAIKNAAAASGWRPAEGEPQDGDIVLAHGPKGRHVGVMVETSKGLRLLHADGHMTVRRKDGHLVPVGSVVAVLLRDAAADGYGEFEVWRHP